MTQRFIYRVRQRSFCRMTGEEVRSLLHRICCRQVETPFEYESQTILCSSYGALINNGGDAVEPFQIAPGIEQAVACQIISTQFTKLPSALAFFMKNGTAGSYHSSYPARVMLVLLV